jgi:hypothetical protein
LTSSQSRLSSSLYPQGNTWWRFGSKIRRFAAYPPDTISASAGIGGVDANRRAATIMKKAAN